MADTEGFWRFITTGKTEGDYEQVVNVAQICISLGIEPNLDFGQNFKLVTWGLLKSLPPNINLD